MEKAGSKQGRDKKVTRGWQEGDRIKVGKGQDGGKIKVGKGRTEA